MKSFRPARVLLLPVLSLAAAAQSTSLVSVSPSGEDGNGWSWQESLSASGRYLAFYSEADNLVPDDTNGEDDVFIRDLRQGLTRMVSVNPMGLGGNGESEFPSLSYSGRWVAFFSEASDLVPDDTNGFADIFVRDLKAGVTTRVSVSSTGEEALGDSGLYYGPALSGDGTCVAFYSLAPNLVPGDTNGTWDVFVHDRKTGETSRVSVTSDGEQTSTLLVPQSAPVISADGRFVAFESDASTLVPGDTNRRVDVFLHDRETGETTRFTGVGGVEPDLGSRHPSLSGDGRFLAVMSISTNVIRGDTNGSHDVFLLDRRDGSVKRVSLTLRGGQANGPSQYPVLSHDGRFLVFESRATDIVPNDTNDRADLFLRELSSVGVTRISVGDEGQQSLNSCYAATMSADARVIAFWTAAPNLVENDDNGFPDVYLRRLDDRAFGQVVKH